jgi:hypothetical protein
MKKIIFHSSLLWLAFIAFTLTIRAQKTGRTDNSYRFMQIKNDSSYNPVRTFVIYRDESLYNITMEGNKVLELSIDGRKLPADSFRVYDPLIRKISEQIKRDREQAVRDQEQAVRDREQAVRDRAQAVKDQEQAQRDKLQAERDVEQAQRDKIQAEQEAVRDKMQAERDQEQAGQDRIQAQKDKQQAERDMVQAQKDKMQAERDQLQAVRDREQAQRDIKFAEEDRAMLKALISDVVKDGLAPDEKSVNEVRLDEYEFILNGKKQSDELFKKYKDKYMKTPTSRFSFHR